MAFNGLSHTREYCVNIADFDHEKFIPNSIAMEIESRLGRDWLVATRGTRLEICSRKFFLGYRDDKPVVDAIKCFLNKHFKDSEFILECDVNEVKKFSLPMLLVLDEELTKELDDIVFVRCAIIKDCGVHWLVKPVEMPYYDAQSSDRNRQFHFAWWRIAEGELTAQNIEERFDVAPLRSHEAYEVNHLLEQIWRYELRAA